MRACRSSLDLSKVFVVINSDQSLNHLPPGQQSLSWLNTKGPSRCGLGLLTFALRRYGLASQNLPAGHKQERMIDRHEEWAAERHRAERGGALKSVCSRASRARRSETRRCASNRRSG